MNFKPAIFVKVDLNEKSKWKEEMNRWQKEFI